MRRLMLLRHAKTETQSASGRDFDRELDARGVADATQMGHWLAQADLPQRVLVSTAVRAQQTWRAIAAVLGDGVQAVDVDKLYNATPTELIRAIREHGVDASPLMVIAHNPGLHELALGLTRDGDATARRALGDNLPTSALVVLDFDVATWDDASFQTGHLADFVTPKTLREKPRETLHETSRDADT